VQADSVEQVELQISHLVSAISTCAMEAKVSLPAKPVIKGMPWWTVDLCALRSKARFHHKAWSKHKNADSELLYRRSKAVYQRALRAAKCCAWKKFRESASDGDVFRALSDFTGKSSSIQLSSEILIDGTLTSDPVAIADGCARHFFPVEPPSDSSHSEIEATAWSALSLSLDETPPVISDWEFETAARLLNSKSAPGPDGLSADLLLFSLPLVKPFLLVILNACISLCFFPVSWKIAKVVVIGKQNKSDYSTLNSYRPISLVSNLAKFLEKVILGRLAWFASVNGWFCVDQHGFRENRSTETAAHSLVNYIEDAFFDQKVCASAFLDIKSAFDSAWHPAIISALVNRGCPIYLTKIVDSFLSNRQACFSINEYCLKRNVNLGCPQGGVLSPFLWNLLVDDLLRIPFPFPTKFSGYADDANIATVHKDPSIATHNLQLACDSIGKWLATKKLFLNAAKTVLVVFSRKQITWANLSVLIDGTKISPSHSASFLGLVLDTKLNWANHIQAKCVSAKRAMMAVSSCLRQSFGADCKRLRFLYSSAVEPIFTYGCSVWVSSLRTKAGIKKVRSFQRTICRIIACAFKTAPTESLILLSNLLPLDLRILEIATLRLLSHPPGLVFSKASRDFICKRLSFVNNDHLLPRVSFPLLTNCPPWNILLFSSLLSSVAIPLLPSTPSTLYCFIRAHHRRGAAGFCVVFTDSSAVREVLNFSLPPAISFRTGMSLAFSTALEKIGEYRPAFSACEIFVSEQLIFMQPATQLYPIEARNLALLATFGSFCHIFTTAIAKSPGLILARFWAQAPSPFSSLLVPFSPLHVKHLIRSTLWDIWSNEWSSIPTNFSAKAFFPVVRSANVLLERRTNATSTQLITGHCFLNSYLHRFGLSPSASCLCGAPSETIPHFILHCPIFSSLRSTLVDVVSSSGHPWPPPLHIFPQCNLLWNALTVFVSRSKRLIRKKRVW